MTACLSSIENPEVGGSLHLASGLVCGIRRVVADVIYCDVPGMRYGRWWDKTRLSVLGMPEYDVWKYIPPGKEST